MPSHDHTTSSYTSSNSTLLQLLNILIHLLLRLPMPTLRLLLPISRLRMRLILPSHRLSPSPTLLTLLRLRPIPASRPAARPLLHRRHIRRASLQVDIHPALIMLRAILQALLLTDALDRRLDLLDVPWAVIPLAHYDVQMVLALRLGGADACFEDLDCFVDELAVEIDGVRGHLVDGVVLQEDVVGRLFVVLICGRLVLLAGG
jgi:hypothetical protein